MAAKFFFLAVALFLVIQTSCAAERFRRDAPAADGEAPEADKAENAFESFKSGFENFFKSNVQPEKIWQNLNTNWKDLGEKVQAGATDFASTIQKSTNDLLAQKQ